MEKEYVDIRVTSGVWYSLLLHESVSWMRFGLELANQAEHKDTVLLSVPLLSNILLNFQKQSKMN